MEKITVNVVSAMQRNIVVRYLIQMENNKLLLWCYLIWYLSMLNIYFITEPALWINSAGLGLIVGYALVLSTGGDLIARLKNRFWATARLFLCPFLVSSFTAMTNRQEFSLFFSPRWQENLLAVQLCCLFTIIIVLARRLDSALTAKKQ